MFQQKQKNFHTTTVVVKGYEWECSRVKEATLPLMDKLYTFAFVIPVLQTLYDNPYGVYCLVLTPTRELALQIGDSFNVLGKPMGLRVVVVTGGRDTIRQSQDLDRRPHIIVATPGRLADQIENNSTFTLSKLKYLVLDEADRLLEGKNLNFFIRNAGYASVPACCG